MELTIENFRNLNLRQIEISNFVDKQKWNQSIQKLSDLKFFIDEMLRIIYSNNQIPKILVDNTNAYAKNFLSLVVGLSEDIKGQAYEVANKKEQAVKKIDDWYLSCIERSNDNPQSIGFYDTFNTLKNLDKGNYEDELIEIETIKKRILSEKESIDNILRELQKKTSNETMSDYAQIFKTESNEHDSNSRKWLVFGISLIVLFLVVLLFTDFYNKFNTEEILSDGKTIKYNVSNLLIKLLIFAVQIFLISFSFKQYSINKHLKTINKHRQNGLNSFKLFVESINKEDYETRNSLMLQLAKAIYEQTSTGYISDKNQGINSGIVEITKMIGANKLD
mgnify:CR=1 FL=1